MRRGYRVFIAITLAAIAWLTPVVAGAAEKLQVLLNDTAAQIQLAYRQHPDEQTTRREQLAAVIAAWRAAPRSEANNERLANWLRAAIRSSMPGSHEPLPPAPGFTAAVKVEAQPQPQVAPQSAEGQTSQPRPAEFKAAESQPAEAGKVEVTPAPAEPQPSEAVVEKKAPEEAAVKPTSELSEDPSRNDPFRDDPETESKGL
jgi:hypothetical protein